jgi:outer membrane protein assembly factor BamA
VNSSFADESGRPQGQVDRLKVTVEDVKFDGAIHLPNEILEQLIASIKQHEFEMDSDGLGEGQEAPITNASQQQRQLKKRLNAESPVLSRDSSWLREVQEVIIMGAWQEQGYFTVHTSVESQVLSRDSTSQHVSITVRVNEGPQYRLGEVEFRSAQDPRPAPELLFPPDELRQQIPLREGDLFNVQKIREGLDALRRLYLRKGYIDFTASTITSVDDVQQTVSLLFELDPQERFRVSTIEILGLDPALESLLRSQIRSGDIFDATLINSFYKDHKSALPPDASPADNEVRRNVKDGTVEIKLNFRPCLAPQD